MGQVAKGMAQPRFELGLRSLSDWGGTFMHVDLLARFQLALLVSFLLHLFLVVGVTMRPPDRAKPKSAPSLEVVLVNSRTATVPQSADRLAQSNLDGGGNTDADRHARSPLPLLKHHDPQPDVTVPARRAEPREQEARRLMTQTQQAAPAVSQPQERAPTEPQPDAVQAPSSADLVARSMEVARLEAAIAKNWDSYQKRPRRRFIGARTQEFRFARYVEDWRSKVERVGTLNYPQVARDQRIFGTLQLTVAIRHDGSVESVEINRPSGQKVLDDAAIRIVRLAAPYAAFPPDIAQDTDILSITRTWSFTRADQFQAE